MANTQNRGIISSQKSMLPMRAIMDKIKANKGGKSAPPGRDARTRPQSSPPPRNPAQSENLRSSGIGAGEEEGGNQEEMQVPRLTPQEVEARRRAFPDLYKFLDKFEGINRGPSAHEQPAMQMQREEKKKVHSKLYRFADEEETEEDEERWDESVLFDAPLATTSQQLNMSAEEHETLLEVNEFARRLHQEDDTYEDDTNVLLFRKLDQENELLRIQHEHVQNMPEFIGFNEEFEEEETRIRQEWMDDPRSVTADHAQELYNNLEQARQRLWAKYTKQAGERFLAENFDELVKEKLMKKEDDDQELDEEGLRQKLLRSPYARLLDPTFRK